MTTATEHGHYCGCPPCFAVKMGIRPDPLGSRTAAGLVEHASVEWRIKIAHADRQQGKGIMAQLSQASFARYIAVLEESR